MRNLIRCYPPSYTIHQWLMSHQLKFNLFLQPGLSQYQDPWVRIWWKVTKMFNNYRCLTRTMRRRLKNVNLSKDSRSLLFWMTSYKVKNAFYRRLENVNSCKDSCYLLF